MGFRQIEKGGGGRSSAHEQMQVNGIIERSSLKGMGMGVWCDGRGGTGQRNTETIQYN